MLFFLKIDFGPFSSPESIFKIIYIFGHQKLGRRKAEFCGFFLSVSMELLICSVVFMWGKPHFLIAFGACQADYAFILTPTFYLLTSILFARASACTWAIFGLRYPHFSNINYLCIDSRYREGIDILRQENYF